jgi:hypothetical protein
VGKVLKLNDMHETIVDCYYVVSIRKRVRKFSRNASEYYLDVFLNVDQPANKIELEYTDQAWRDKDYTLIYNGMGMI